MTRRALRESVFKILFRYEFNPVEEMDEQLGFAINELAEKDDEEDAPTEILKKDTDRAYITDRVRDILSNMSKIDEILEEASEGWSLSRMGKAELAIMRLAIYEIKFDDDIDCNVALNEAVELSKKYCNTEAKGFVNAVLQKVVNNI